MKKNIFKIPFLVIFLCSIVLEEEESLVEKQLQESLQKKNQFWKK